MMLTTHSATSAMHRLRPIGAIFSPESVLFLFRKLEEGFSEDHPEWFAAAPLKAKMKREVPATEAQKKYLADLIRYHELDLEPEWGALTKSRASRMIDQIILAHGRMEKRQRTEKK